jgi:hypothetical protein
VIAPYLHEAYRRPLRRLADRLRIAVAEGERRAKRRADCAIGVTEHATLATASRICVANSARSTARPSSLAYMMRTKSSGRGRLPACVVRKRLMLVSWTLSLLSAAKTSRSRRLCRLPLSGLWRVSDKRATGLDGSDRCVPEGSRQCRSVLHCDSIVVARRDGATSIGRHPIVASSASSCPFALGANNLGTAI